MKKRSKQFFLSLVVAFLLLTTVSSVYEPKSVSANDEVVTPNPNDPPPEPNTPSPRITINRLAYNQNDGDGIIMHDQPQIPNSWSAAKALANSQPETHTGWSTSGDTKICKMNRTAYDGNGNVVWPDVSYPNTSSTVKSWLTDWDSSIRYSYWGEGIEHRDYAFRHETYNQRDKGSLEVYAGQLNAKYHNLIEKHGIKSWAGVRGELAGAAAWRIEADSRGENTIGDCTSHNEVQRKWNYVNNEILMTGWIQADREYPGGPDESVDTDNGDLTGKVYWELVRHDETKNSGVNAYVDLSVTGKHYATRDVKQTLNLGGQTKTSGRDTPIKMQIPDGMTVKNQKMSVSFEYEYTNFYNDIFKCVDQDGPYCYEWHFVERVPDWDFAENFEWRKELAVDHKMLEVIEGEHIEDVLKSYLIGRSLKVDHKSKSTESPHYEAYQKNKENNRVSTYNLLTQSSLPITPGKLDYKATFPSGGHGGDNVLRKEKTYGYYFPADVDESLKERYKNNTAYSDYAYAFPLQQSTQTGPNSNQVWDYDTDLFFMSEALGYMSGYPYADMVKQKVMHNRELPSYQKLMQDGSEKLERDFIQDWDYGFFDEVLYTDDPSEFYKIQRYQIPIQGDSILKPKEVHQNHIVLENMGLNDLTFRFNQSFLFRHYFIGHGADDPWLMEQVESRPTKMHEYDPELVHTITISNEQIKQLAAQQAARPKERIHGFRRIDRDIIEKTEAILGYKLPVGD